MMGSTGRATARNAVRAALCMLGIVGLAGYASAELTYTIGGSWPNQAHRDAADAAMAAVTARYNAYAPNGFDNRDVYVYYNAGIPTAQASYHGSIGFGGTYPNERVTAHELAHYLGLPSGNWGALMSGSGWTGAKGAAKVKQFDGEQATINGDGIHFWPYGLNFDSEGSLLNRQRQVAIVYAMRADMGIGPTAHPAPTSRRGVQLTASDPVGESSFNRMERWSDGYFAHEGGHYDTEDFLLRTPASSNEFKFYGESLTVNNTNGADGGLWFGGTSSSATVTIDDLRLEGGWVQHNGANTASFNLDGGVSVDSPSSLHALRGDINLLADVSGSADLTIEAGRSSRSVRFQSASNAFVGDLINNLSFELADGANYTFALGAGGATNKITGASARATQLNGVFELDLSAADPNSNDTWTLVDAANTTYGSTFRVDGFDGAAGRWSNGEFSYDQATGQLTTVPRWAIDGQGAWSTASNWTSGAVPVAEATLGSALTPAGAPAAVTLDTPVSLTRLTFDNASSYRLEGPQTLTLTGAAFVAVKAGQHTIATSLTGSEGMTLEGPGELILTAPATYTGATHLRSGKLTLSGQASLANTSGIQIDSGATLDATTLQLASQTLDVASGARVEGAVEASGGSSVAGTGEVTGALTLRSGSTLRVGEAGLPVAAAPTLIDNFDGYNNASNQNVGAHPSGDVTGGAWDGVFDGTSNGQVVSNGEQGNPNSLIAFGVPSQGSGGWRGAVTDLANNFAEDHSLADGGQATYFLQILSEGNAYTDTALGLTESTSSVDINNAWQDYAVRPVVVGDPGSIQLIAGGSLISSMTDGEWRNLWLVVDNDAKTYDIYTSTGTDDGVLALSNASFGPLGSPVDLAAFGLTGREDGRVRLDNLYTAPGVFTANPLAEGGGVVFAAETFTVGAGLTLEADTTVALDGGGSGVSDQVLVGGELVAAGTLEVVLAPEALALGLGDSYDLFDFASASGAFDRYLLPELAEGLRWDVSGLTTDGSVTVVAGLGGDFNADGTVDAADYVVWRNNFGAEEDSARLGGVGDGDGTVGAGDLAIWKANYGQSLGSTLAVPEPASAVLLVGALLAVRRR